MAVATSSGGSPADEGSSLPMSLVNKALVTLRRAFGALSPDTSAPEPPPVAPPLAAEVSPVATKTAAERRMPPEAGTIDAAASLADSPWTPARLHPARRPAPWPPENLSLALQGGGSFGAFTWGVLDRLLEEPDIDFDAVSGSSAGAVNAVLLASGMIDGGREGARARLEQFWRRMSRAAALMPKPVASPFGAGLELVVRSMSPYQFNPFNLNPLREALVAAVDFERLRRRSPI